MSRLVDPYGVRWGSRGKFHLSQRKWGMPVCGYRFPQSEDGAPNTTLDQRYVPRAIREGAVCHRCLAKTTPPRRRRRRGVMA